MPTAEERAAQAWGTAQTRHAREVLAALEDWLAWFDEYKRSISD